jgi:hypothetical protein
MLKNSSIKNYTDAMISVCEACPDQSKILNPHTGRCIDKETNVIAKELKHNIEVCENYFLKKLEKQDTSLLHALANIRVQVPLLHRELKIKELLSKDFLQKNAILAPVVLITIIITLSGKITGLLDIVKTVIGSFAPKESSKIYTFFKNYYQKFVASSVYRTPFRVYKDLLNYFNSDDLYIDIDDFKQYELGENPLPEYSILTTEFTTEIPISKFQSSKASIIDYLKNKVLNTDVLVCKNNKTCMFKFVKAGLNSPELRNKLEDSNLRFSRVKGKAFLDVKLKIIPKNKQKTYDEFSFPLYPQESRQSMLKKTKQDLTSLLKAYKNAIKKAESQFQKLNEYYITKDTALAKKLKKELEPSSFLTEDSTNKLFSRIQTANNTFTKLVKRINNVKSNNVVSEKDILSVIIPRLVEILEFDSETEEYPDNEIFNTAPKNVQERITQVIEKRSVIKRDCKNKEYDTETVNDPDLDYYLRNNRVYCNEPEWLNSPYNKDKSKFITKAEIEMIGFAKYFNKGSPRNSREKNPLSPTSSEKERFRNGVKTQLPSSSAPKFGVHVRM